MPGVLPITSAEQLFSVIPPEELTQRAYPTDDEGEVYDYAHGPHSHIIAPLITGVLVEHGIPAVEEAHTTNGEAPHHITSVTHPSGDPYEDLILCGTWRQYGSPDFQRSYRGSTALFPLIIVGKRIEVMDRVVAASWLGTGRQPHGRNRIVGLGTYLSTKAVAYMPETLTPTT